MCSARASGRYSGDEFVIILPETNQRQAFFVAERLRRAVEQARFTSANPTCAQGIDDQRWLGRLGQLKREPIEYADAALYAAKKDGRNRVVCYSDLRRKEASLPP